MQVTQELEKWAILARCSEEEQVEDGYSIEVQFNDSMKKLKEIPNAIFYKTYADEGYSGSDPYYKRPDLLRMLADAKSKKFQGLIVWKADRIGRLSNEREELILALHKYGIKIICCSGENLMDNTPQGKFVRKTFANVDQLEVEILAMRVKGAINTIIESGEWKGGAIPYSLQWCREDKSKKSPGKMIPINEEQTEQVKKIFELYVYNLMGFNSIRDYMNLEENNTPYYKNGEKHKFNKDHIKTILKSPIYCAYQYNNNVYTKFEPREDGVKHKPREEWELHPVNFVEPIISKDMFDMAQKIMQQKASKTMTITKTTWLLTGILTCENCNTPFMGHPMRTKYTRKKDGTTVEYDSSFYRCAGKARFGKDYCNTKQIAKKLIEETIVEQSLKFLSNLEQFISDDVMNDINKRTKKIKNSTQNRLSSINKELDKIEKGLKRVIRDYQDGELKTQSYNLAIEDFMNRKEILELEKEDLNQSTEEQTDINEELKQFKVYFDKWYQSLINIDYSQPNSVMIAKGTLIQIVDFIRWDGKALKLQFIAPKQLADYLCKDGGRTTGQPTDIHKKKLAIESIFKDGIINYDFMFKKIV